jgi:tetratricopeptide (TPR) repeat protein
MFPAAAAEGPDDAARAAYKRGNEAFADRRYQEALVAFTEGYDLSKRPRFLLNIAHTHRKMGQMREALATYKRFLVTEPAKLDKEAAEQSIVEVEQFLAEEEALKKSEPAPAAAPEPLPVVPAPAPVADLSATSAEPAPLHRRWYFWAGVGAVVVAGVATAVLLSSGSETSFKDNGTWGSLRL